MRRTIVIAGSVSLAGWILLAWLSHGLPLPGNLGNGFHYEIANDDKPIGVYLGLHAVLCTILVIVLGRLRRNRASGSRGFWLVIGFAVAFRVVLIPSVPILESDFYRYLWDGKVANHGINPFRHTPWDVTMFDAESALEITDTETRREFRKGGIEDTEVARLESLNRIRQGNPVWFERVSHPEVRTVYPPLAQALFAVSSFLFGDSVAGLKCLILVFDLGVVFTIAAILRRLGRTRLWVLGYAWNPLVVKEFANSAHYDALAVFFTVAAVWAAVVAKPAWKTALVLAGGALAKYVSGLLLPILVRPQVRNWPACMVFGLALFAGFLPFYLWGDAGFERLFDGLGVYVERWHYNGAVFTPVWLAFLLANESVGDLNENAAKFLCGLALLSTVLFLVLRKSGDGSGEDLARRTFVVMAAFFLLSPTAFPWYYTWVLPFVCVFPSAAWIGLSFLLPLNYLDFYSPEAAPSVHRVFLYLPMTWWLIWLPFALLLVLEHWRAALFFPAHHHAIAADDDEDRPGDLERFEDLPENQDPAD